MARFNQKGINEQKTTNLAGGSAYKQSPELELISILLTSFVENKYYESTDETINRMVKTVAKLQNPIFAAKAAVYAREVFGMRSITHVLAAIIAHEYKGERWTAPFFNRIVRRPDDMLEIMSVYSKLYATRTNGRGYPRPLPNAMKKGFAKKLESLDEYALLKYAGNGKEINMKDMINICHPNSGKNPVLDRFMKDELSPPETWEVLLTQAGNVEGEEERKQVFNNVWEKLLKENKLGYFALLKNLRNIALQSPRNLRLALDQLVDEGAILHPRNLVMPFRYLTAYIQFKQEDNPVNVSDTNMILRALNKAATIACSNVPDWEGRTLVALDTSGSMFHANYSSDLALRPKEPSTLGSLFAAAFMKSLASKGREVELMFWQNEAKYVNIDTEDSLLSLTEQIRGKAIQYTGGTDINTIFQKAKRKYDRIIILSDEQSWLHHRNPSAALNEYCKEYECNPLIYSLDLAGYGTLQFPQDRVCCAAGYGETIFDIMRYVETDKNALVNEVNKLHF